MISQYEVSTVCMRMVVHGQDECNCGIIHYRLNSHFLTQPSKIRIQNIAQGTLLLDCAQLIEAKYSAFGFLCSEYLA